MATKYWRMGPISYAMRVITRCSIYRPRARCSSHGLPIPHQAVRDSGGALTEIRFYARRYDTAYTAENVFWVSNQMVWPAANPGLELDSLQVQSMLATHDLDAAACCARVVVLDGGSLAADGTPEQVITAALLEKVFHVRGRVLKEGGRVHVVPEI